MVINGAAGFLFVNMIVKKERHGRIMTTVLETHYILLARRLLTLHKPTEQKLIDNRAQFSMHLDTSRMDVTEVMGN